VNFRRDIGFSARLILPRLSVAVLLQRSRLIDESADGVSIPGAVNAQAASPLRSGEVTEERMARP